MLSRKHIQNITQSEIVYLPPKSATMKISYNWLKQFITIDWPAEKTGELLTDLGLEVEGIQTYQSIPGGLEGIVVGHVLTCEQHPNADRLKVTTVDIGGEAPLQIVCGAPNVAQGQKVPVATVGTTLYTPEGEAWKIKKGKIRGEISLGMICAEDELGLGKSHDGIMVLDAQLTPGTPCAQIFNIENDQVFEIGLTPNRADAMSHFGTARDLKAGLVQHKTNAALNTPSVSEFKVENRLHKVDVQVLDKERAPRYAGVTISGLKITTSPEWLQHRLKAIGLSPINNVVDATNYVLHELGQPLHAFDLNKISDNRIEVKTCEAGTKFKTLDGIERTLHADDLMICDGEKPMCIAGVFGGEYSGVNDNTTAIFLESAYFNPVSVRKTAKRHGLNTDASFRFERGIDPNITEYALKRAALLIQEVAGGDITSDIVDIYPTKIEDHQVFLSFENTSKLIGEEIHKETIKSILTSLDIKINNVTETGIGMTIPAYRNDVTREVDVIEEILRVYGYNNINFGSKLNATIANVSKFEDYNIQKIIGDLLASSGFYETMTNSLTNPAYISLTETLSSDHNVQMLNPLGQELSIMRQSMIFSGLESIKHNANRRNKDVKLFEFGKNYKQFDDKREETKHLALYLTGNRNIESWHTPSNGISFFYLKKIVDLIFERLGISKLQTKNNNDDIFSEAICYAHGKTTLVTFGILNSKITKAFDVDQEVLYADFNWDQVLVLSARKNIKFTEIQKYPEVRRDFALLVDHSVTFNQIETLAKQTEKQLLTKVDLFDVYTGKNLPEGKKSYAVSFILQDNNKTLNEKTIDKTMNKLQSRFEKELGATLR